MTSMYYEREMLHICERGYTRVIEPVWMRKV
jgi:hypothetical protein